MSGFKLQNHASSKRKSVVSRSSLDLELALLHKSLTTSQVKTPKGRKRTMEMESKKLNFRNSRSNPALVLGTDKQKKIILHPKETKSHATTRSDMSKTDTADGPSNQATILKKDKKTRSSVVHSHHTRSYSH